MPGDKLSAKEAALIAQARAELQDKASARAAQPDAPQRGAPPAARLTCIERVASGPVPPPARALDAAERLALLMAAARAENERLRRRQRMLYLWVPFAFMSVTALWTLIWMWQQM